MDFSREESLIVVKISEAIQQGRLNAAAEHVTARSVALAAGANHWVTAFVLDLLDVPADAPERGPSVGRAARLLSTSGTAHTCP